MFFSYNTYNSYSSIKKQRMSHTTTTLARQVKGAKDLKEYIGQVTTMLQGIRDQFIRDLQDPRAIVKKQHKTYGTHEFRAHMAEVSHRDFIYHREKLPQCSKFLQAEMAAQALLEQIEDLRKMIVNNKQQKKTDIRTIRQIIVQARTLPAERDERNRDTTMRAAATNDDDVDASSHSSRHERVLVAWSDDTTMTAATDDDNGDALQPHSPDHELVDLEYEHPAVKSLQKLIHTTKRNHRTVSRNLLNQVKANMAMMRGHIMTFKVEAENAIGEIIHHAEKCRAFITHMYHLDLIEFCASAWWFETQKDAMDHSDYYVSVAAVGEPKYFDANFPQTPYTAFPHSPMPLLKIRVHGTPQSMSHENLICEHVIDQELAETILTEEAVRAFEENPAYQPQTGGHQQPTVHAVPEDEVDDDDDDDEEPSMTTWGATTEVWECMAE